MDPNPKSLDKKHIITIAGRPGSGKSTAAKSVAKLLKFEHFSSGDLFRALGKDHGADVLQANKSAEVSEKLDQMVDGKLREIGASKDRMVIDSRTAWHWIPTSFKVYLDLDLAVAAQRILQEVDKDRLMNEKIHDNPLEYAHLLQRRLDNEAKRYREKYGINPYDFKNYDLVVDTFKNDIDQVVKIIINGFRDWLEN